MKITYDRKGLAIWWAGVGFVVALVLFALMMINFESPAPAESRGEPVCVPIPEYIFLGPAIQFGPAHKMVASWYGPGFHGRQMANGAIYDQMKFTVAHKTLPFGTLLFLENPKTGMSVFAVVGDRGPYVDGRHIDVSLGIAIALGMKDDGIAVLKVRVCK